MQPTLTVRAMVLGPMILNASACFEPEEGQLLCPCRSGWVCEARDERGERCYTESAQWIDEVTNPDGGRVTPVNSGKDTPHVDAGVVRPEDMTAEAGMPADSGESLPPADAGGMTLPVGDTSPSGESLPPADAGGRTPPVGDTSPPDDSTVTEIAACKTGKPLHSFRFQDSKEGWVLSSVQGVDEPRLSHEPASEGSTDGALRVDAAFDGSPDDLAVRVQVEFSRSSEIGCLQADIKIGDGELAERLVAAPAAWFLFAIDSKDWCYAESKRVNRTGWSHDLNNSGSWFRVAVPTAELVTNCAFDPTQIKNIGLGVALHNVKTDNAKIYIDNVMAFP